MLHDWIIGFINFTIGYGCARFLIRSRILPTGITMITRDDLSIFHPEHVLHCRMCLDERPDNVPPKEWSRLSFGSFHKEGEPGIYLQLWCDRHDCNVTTIHIQTDQWTHADHVPLRITGAEDWQEN